MVTFKIILCLMLLGAGGMSLRAESAESSQLPAPLCVLMVRQVICYDMQKAAPHPISPADQNVSDLAISPGGDSVVYRVGDSLIMAHTDGTALTTLTSTAPVPGFLDLTQNTIAWAGLKIAYVTANGLQVIFLHESGNTTQEDTSRLYINLRFSPFAKRLAAQSNDGAWRLFDVQEGLMPLNTLDMAGDLAWFDEDHVVIAPTAGGLRHYTLDGTQLKQDWALQSDFYAKLISSGDGQVFAMHLDPADTIGNIVQIGDKGDVLPVGTAKIDARALWGPDGEILLYLTSGTPIFIDRATGAEDMLPMRRVLKLVWASIPPPADPVCRIHRPCPTWR